MSAISILHLASLGPAVGSVLGVVGAGGGRNDFCRNLIEKQLGAGHSPINDQDLALRSAGEIRTETPRIVDLFGGPAPKQGIVKPAVSQSAQHLAQKMKDDL